MSMYCQKCRTQLKVDKSVENLNPASFNLLTGSTGASLASSTLVQRQGIPQDRLNTYEKASQHSQSPQFRRQIPGPGANTVQHGAPTTPTKPRSASKSSGRAGATAKENPQMSFMMLSESQWTPPPGASVSQDDQSGPRDTAVHERDSTNETPSLSSQVEATNRLYSILSSRSDIDHPICTECTELVLTGLQTRLATATRERDAYISFQKVQENSVPTDAQVRAAQKALDQSRSQAASALAKLKALEAESARLAEEQAALDDEAAELDREEALFWSSRNELTSRLSAANEHKMSLSVRVAHDSASLAALQRTNVYNDAFCIGHDGYFGTINGLRLGRLPSQNVEWAEINAAWGQAALLLLTVAEKLNFTFDGYKIRPCGSVSRIERVEPDRNTSKNTRAARGSAAEADPPKVVSLELYASSDIPLVGRFSHGRFERAMIAFLECVRQLGAFVERGGAAPSGSSNSPPSTAPTITTPADSPGRPGAHIPLPYAIKRDRIGDVSIKLGFGGQDENWTRACKHALTCCKFLLATASNWNTGTGQSGAEAGR
ncbi:MAG: autophagy protein 6 [Vezdaea aestivalis]|nr:MAG: autophagy protein 6 [Vezdaea aestivalis]